MSVMYEVNLKVQKQIEKEFEIWLVGHINDVLRIEGFESASWFNVVSDRITADNETHWTVHYVLRDLQALNQYLEKHAQRMRQPAKDKFGEKFMADRRTFQPIQHFSKSKNSGAV
jgi:hypothetical protein